jgi:hypothetical protein
MVFSTWRLDFNPELVFWQPEVGQVGVNVQPFRWRNTPEEGDTLIFEPNTMRR